MVLAIARAASEPFRQTDNAIGVCACGCGLPEWRVPEPDAVVVRDLGALVVKALERESDGAFGFFVGEVK
jgi:hypothetical protein